MTTVELCKLVAMAEFRPFTKTDFYTVSPEGPHEIATFVADSISYEIVRDGGIVAVYTEALVDPSALRCWHLTAVEMI